MSVISIQAKLTTEDLLAVLEQLAPDEADKVVQRLLHLQARRRSASMPEHEASLLEQIFREKRTGFQARWDELNHKAREFALTPEEQTERLQLIHESEAFTVQRLKALTELAQLRRVNLLTLMKQLGIKAPNVV